MEFNRIFTGKLFQRNHAGLAGTGGRAASPTHLTSALFVFTLLTAVFVAGCGGGGGDTPPNNTPPNNTPGAGGTPPDGDINTPPNGPASTAPVHADAGNILAARVGGVVTLDGSASSTSLAGPLTYAWAFAAKPQASQAELLNATTANPSFTGDVAGPYAVQLIVTAGGISSQRAVAFVEISLIDENLEDGITSPFTGRKLHVTVIKEGDTVVGTVPKRGYVSECVHCHSDPFDLNPPGVDWIGPKKPGNHVATSSVCQVCHTTFGFSIVSAVDHLEVSGVCSDCHNGVTAVGKSASHVPTTVECDDCHNTTSFLELQLDGSYNHAGINRDCGACHNGIVATGKPVDEIHNSISSDCSACHITDNFQTTNVDHSSITQACVECHNGIIAVGKTQQNHPTTTADCSMCHNTETFVFVDGVNFDHTVIDFTTTTCESCHNNDIDSARGKSALTHIPTTEDCSVCHITGGTFATGFFLHTGVVDNCASCHDGVITTGISANHVPTTQDCAVCHTTETFVGAAFDHAAIVDNCATCHDGVTATGKPVGVSDNTGKVIVVTHIPTLDDCSVCHNDTGSFKSSTFLAAVHPGISGGCEGCHNSRMLPPTATKSVDHLSTDQDCDSCHTSTAFTPANFTHVGISGNCASCHDGTNDATGAIGLSANHISTTADCGLCHNTVSFTPAFVDHSSPEVVGKRCDSCHDGVSAKGTGLGHINIRPGDDCNVCHVTGTFATVVFSHESIIDNCVSCHEGANAIATVKPNTHVPTTEDCFVCHNTTAFAGARFDHRGIGDNCASCHNGNTATGKSTGHVQTNSDCALCHVTTGFVPATNFDHTGIVDNCVSCHDGVRATGKPTNHLLTELDCVLCHTTETFVGGTFDHQGDIGSCSSCHNGTQATGMSSQHFDTTQECNICHSTRGWAPISFTHSTADYPGDHNGNVGCISCHRDNSQRIIFPHPQPDYAGTCAACHAGDYDPGESDHNGLSNDLNCEDSGCHKVDDRKW